MKYFYSIILFSFVFLLACTGSKKYFKAAEKLEKQGLVNEAAEFYMVSLQRKPTNVDARIKLKEVGQKYVSFMSSEFFRNYNTNQLELSIDNFEKMKDFTSRSQGLSVTLNYPTGYEDDYKAAIEKYCDKNYHIGSDLVKQKNYKEALVYLNKVDKYKPEYKKNGQLKITATCEPLYQNAIAFIETKNYAQALTILNNIHRTTESYKDSKELFDLCSAQQVKHLLLFQQKNSPYPTICDFLFNNFSQVTAQDLKHVEVINNSPFGSLPSKDSENNIDVIQGIRKASGADYFYSYELQNKKSQVLGPTKANAVCFQKVTYRKNDTVIITEYRPTNYYQVKSQRTYSYEFKYKLINASTNQNVSIQTVTLKKLDQVEYNEFAGPPKGNINDYFPYNPQVTPPLKQFNPKAWRALFTANKVLKTEQELENMTNQEAIKLYSQTIKNYIK